MSDKLPDSEELEKNVEEKAQTNKSSLMKFLGGKLPEDKNAVDKEIVNREDETAAEAL